MLAEMPAEAREAVRAAEESGNFDTADYQDAMTVYHQRHLCRLVPWPDALQRTFAGMGMPVYLDMWGPSEFTCSEHDEARPASVARFCGLVPGARMLVIEDASHSHHLEQPCPYLAAVRDFLGE